MLSGRVSRRRQGGLGMWGWIMVMGLIAFFSIVGLKTGPIYLNHMSLMRVLKGVAEDPANANATVAQIRYNLDGRFAIDYVTDIKPNDIKVIRTQDGGRALFFDYDVVKPLFYNVSVMVSFEGQVPLRKAGGDTG